MGIDSPETVVTHDHEKWMTRALELAWKAENHGEVPVGAVVVLDNKIVGEGFNQTISTHDPSAHAEIIALRNAGANLNNYRLPECDLYVTIEPCAMCAGAMIHARIKKLFFGATEPKAGAVISQLNIFDGGHLNHRVSYRGGILEQDCSALISDFFRSKR